MVRWAGCDSGTHVNVNVPVNVNDRDLTKAETAQLSRTAPPLLGDRPAVRYVRPMALRRVGMACSFALGIALLAGVPGALRTARSGGSFLEGWLGGTAMLLPVVVLGLLLVGAAARGFRAMVGTAPPRTIVLGIALWIGLSLPLLAALGAVLKATTHHRGLGGTTFAVLGAGAVIGAALLAHRLVISAQAWVERGAPPGLVAAIGAAVCVLPLVVVGAPLAGGAATADAAGAVRAAIVDLAIVVVATALVASLEPTPRWQRFAIGGMAAALVVTAAGLARLGTSPGLAQAMRAGGGLPATLLAALEGWTDRDGDGMGARFGGRDCDEGDPARHPGAAEVAGDGIDQDCDGTDPRAPVAIADPAPPAADGTPPAAIAVEPGAASEGPAGPASVAAPGAPPASAAPAAPGVVLPAATQVAIAAPPPERRPDIVLVTLDTVRADHTSAYGYAKDTTPALKALAERGVRFEHAFATATDTQRALAPLVTGRRLSQSARDRREWPTLYAENDTIAERMRRAGYATGAVTSFTWLSDDRGFAQGFDRFETVYDDAHPEKHATGALAADRALGLIAELGERKKPIFLWVHLFDAHERYVRHPGIDMGKGTVGAYDGEVAFVDRQLGRIADAVAASPRAGRTAFLVHGSHGEAFDEHQTSGHGAELWNEVLRVPLVLVAPGLAPAAPETAVSTLDVAPTVLALAGAPAEGVLGTSLLGIAGGVEGAAHPPVYARTGKRAALVDWPLKLLVIERKKKDRTLLFDLAADPGEKRDLSGDRPEDLIRLSGLLAQAEEEAGVGARD
jgi:choline-sulfatase